MFLEEILSYKKIELDTKKQHKPFKELYKQLDQAEPVRSFINALQGETISLIAEVKKASPSKGLLCLDFNPVVLGRSYESAGAAAISVLTDEKYFQGSLEYLRQVKTETQKTPVLRKDFIIDAYQLIEARVFGADAALLIVAALNKTDLHNFIQEAINLELTPLVEVHDRQELDKALDAGAKVIGINNRDLKSFHVNLDTTYQLLSAIPSGIISVSESGIRNRKDIEELEKAGVKAVLVGESIVTAGDPEKHIKELLGLVS